jgi:hypothetical protein
MRSLLAKHANLFMSIKLDSAGPQRTSPFAPDGGLKPGWLNLLNEFADRFVIGSDQFYEKGDARVSAARRFVNALPNEVATAVARDNSRRIYPLLADQISGVQRRQREVRMTTMGLRIQPADAGDWLNISAGV